MTTAPISYRESTSRIRPVNLPRDLPQLQRLLRDVFSATLDADARRALNNMNNPSNWFYRIGHVRRKLHAGFVWELDNALIGNVSLMPTNTAGRVILANVAVSPNHRRQGGARELLATTLNHLAEVNANVVTLQVDMDNKGAIDLYQSLGFVAMGCTTYWQAKPGEWSELAAPTPSGRVTPGYMEIRPLIPSEWQHAYELDLCSQPMDLNWPDLIKPERYRAKLLRQINDFLNGRQSETWTAKIEGELLGIASIWSEWGQPHRLTIRIQPDHPLSHDLSRALLAKLLRRLRFLRRRHLSCEHLQQDEVMAGLMKTAGFYARRHLVTMKLEM